jgi:hypothetical protein
MRARRVLCLVLEMDAISVSSLSFGFWTRTGLLSLWPRNKRVSAVCETKLNMRRRGNTATASRFD